MQGRSFWVCTSKGLILPFRSGGLRIRGISAILSLRNTKQFWPIRQQSAGGAWLPSAAGPLLLGRLLHRKGILAAIAHTDAVYDEVLAAVRNGYSLVTHLYSAMSGVTRRNGFRFPGVIESTYLLDELDVELIADGVHLPGPLPPAGP